jgi:signal transduction histidine kinase
MVSMSELEMEQVLVNVIHNALESGEQEIHVRVEVEQLKSDELVCATVHDDGLGSEAENRGHIFDPFYTTRLRQGGSGLGLSVAYGIVASHGGHIEVDGDEGVGTTIRIVLPLANRSRPTT